MQVKFARFSVPAVGPGASSLDARLIIALIVANRIDRPGVPSWQRPNFLLKFNSSKINFSVCGGPISGLLPGWGFSGWMGLFLLMKNRRRGRIVFPVP